MDFVAYMAGLLYQMGVRNDDGSPLHEDAKFTAFLAQELEQLETRTYDIKYPELKAKQLIPVSHATSPGAATTAYDQYDMFGEAAVVSNYADDIPLVDVMKERFVTDIQSIADGYLYSIQDIRGAQFAGIPLDAMRASTARRVIEYMFERIAAQGLAIGGLKGMLNHPNVPLYSPTTGSWSTASAAQMLADMHGFVDAIITANKETFYPDTYIMDGASRRLIARTRLNTVTQDTVLTAFLAESDYVKMVESWVRCEDMDVAGTGPRHCVYKKDPEVVELDIPQEFESFPPQPKNLAFFVPCHGRIAGVKIRYPLAMGYQDGN